MSITIAEFRKLTRKVPKYRNKRTKLDGHHFDSRKEAKRYGELVLMQKAGEIWGLEVHPKFVFEIDGVYVGRYTADFAYMKRLEFIRTVEDCKSEATKRIRDWPLRKRLMLAIHKIEVIEI